MPDQIRIQSDGTGTTTVITNADGKEIKGVYRAAIEIEANGIVRATLEMGPVTLDTHAENGYVDFTCPFCPFTHRHRCS